MENGKWQMKNDFRFLVGLVFSAKRTNRFERFTVFKPPVLPEESDFWMKGGSRSKFNYRICMISAEKAQGGRDATFYFYKISQPS
jgi:hypothetical protein